ncbi:cytosolic sulfotransferase 18-like [Phragmites australis]|uniref:cytosolic sulfotransferase 18-like n=1 Tax=Phragmites australis TaxID=29695 RepID=UPI002D786F52|nr:cytosolic sulfotransferase 18-like [Phragmites australis]
MAQAKESETKMPTEPVISSESHLDLVSKLPTREGLPLSLVLYKNYWLLPHHADKIMLLQDSFNARPDDTILATNPKCGTTWLKALAFTITNRSRYDFSNHPLLTSHPHEIISFLEVPLGKELTYVEKLPSPRLLATHMPLSLLPKSVANHGCRIVYICREPKDAFVSGWHFGNEIHIGRSTDLDTAFNMFCEGYWPNGPFWDHCLEYWKESIARPDRVLFLKYEEMMADPVNSVKRLATFLGDPFTGDEEEGGVPEEVVRLCSFKMLSELQTNMIGELHRRENVVFKKSAYFRRGKVGDWVNHMSEEMGRKLDYIVEEKFKGSGLLL